MGLRRGRHNRRSGDLTGRIGTAARAIRSELTSAGVVVAACREVERSLAGSTCRPWLPAEVSEDTAPPDVVYVARRSIGRRTEHTYTYPVMGSRRGLLAILRVEGPAIDDEATALIEAIASEAGLALEGANLYERALEALDRSEAIIERVGDGVVVTDPHGTVLGWNRSAERVLGRPSEDAVGSTCVACLGLSRGKQRLDCSGGCALLGLGTAEDEDHEVWRTASDGRRQPLLVSVAPVRDSSGEVSEVVHSIRDITKLKQADEAKMMFLATASHELKTPITVILGFAQSLRSGAADRDTWDYALGAIERRAGELSSIVDRLLLTGRIESGRVRVHTEALDASTIVRERAEAIAATTHRRIEISVRDAPPLVTTDATALGTCLDHLLENAVKYSPDGDPIEVSVSADGSTVDVAVTDRGIGMDAEAIDRCFERFYQAESSDVRRFGGTGIGLYIVRSLAEAMGGSVGVRSRLGEGSTFTLRLRIAGADAPDEPAIEIESASGVGERSMIREFMRQIGVPYGG